MSSRRLADHEARIYWLMANSDLWLGFPQSKRECADDPGATRKRRELVEEMRREGLIAASTNWADVNVFRMIKEARLRLLRQKSALT